ncbi:Trp operon repressor [Providencia heimbachae]|uniref:Trp operon repressor n=2 Tax=Morganellaceae TaxID=1903414 RepID=A0A1B7JQK7_9GAMM|nr:TrpR family transcriptional repressor [Providencia heimbachae ATCC 35613]SQH11981.1 Trp operon repressor [Providencia heimbachae]
MMTADNQHDPALTADENDDWQRFVNLLQLAFEQNIQHSVLQLLLTPDERTALATRVRIVQELMRGEMSQRELKNELGVGIATITRGSNSLKSAPIPVKEWLESKLL